jgi:hypothetical protein
MPLPENCCSTSLFTTGYKRLAEEGQGILISWLRGAYEAAAACWLLCVSTRAAFCTENLIHWL